MDTATVAWAQAAGNSTYLSVETEGYDTQMLNAAQIHQLGLLFRWVVNEYNIPLTTCNHGMRGLTTHAFYPSGLPDPAWGNHPCPGTLRSAQLPDIIAAAVTPQPPQPKEDDEVMYVFASGASGDGKIALNTQWAITEGNVRYQIFSPAQWQAKYGDPLPMAGDQIAKAT